MTAHDIAAWTALNFMDEKGRLNWDAFSAIGTVLAVWFAVWQSFRQSRAEEIKRKGTVNYLIALVNAFEEFVLSDEGEDDIIESYPAELLDRWLRLSRIAKDGIDALTVDEMTSINMAQWKPLIVHSLDEIEKACTTREIGRWSLALQSQEHIEAFCYELRQMRGALERQSLKVTVQLAWLRFKNGWKRLRAFGLNLR